MPYHYWTTCLRCGQAVDDRSKPQHFGHDACRTEEFISNFTIAFDLTQGAGLDWSGLRTDELGVWRYSALLPVEARFRTTLQEGATPLRRLQRMGNVIGLNQIYLKDESQNPTWSQKDRLSAVSVSHALQVGAKVVTVSSSGNHGASTAAYAARAGLRCVVFTLDNTPASMKTFMQAYGAVVVAMTTPEARWELLSRCVKEFGWYPTGNTTNPPIGSDYYGVEGYKTIAFELFEQFNQDVPEVVVVPTALGDVIQGVWKGFLELQALMGTKLPRMVAVEPSGSLTSAADYNLEIPPRVPSPHTLAFSSATTQSSYQALKAVRESGGASITIDEDPIIAATQLRLAQTEGVYGEAASVTSIAALAQLRDRGIVGPDDRIVCILTSGGLKDPSGTAQYLPVVPTLETTDLDRLLGAVADSYGLELP